MRISSKRILRTYLGLLILGGVIVANINRDLAAQQTNSQNSYQQLSDLEYAKVDKHDLLLDLYLPKNIKNPPLLVWIHGGAWRAGSKFPLPILPLVDKGYAIASVDYRLSPVAKFPAQVHDCKAAIRWLRAKQKEYGYQANHITIIGASAGGHLVALIGTTNGHQELEGMVGSHLNESSSVQAIIDLYGPTNLMTILKQSTPHGLSVRVPALKLLIGGRPEEHVEIAKLASPVNHVDQHDPPLLMIHGDQDPQVPINQSHELHGKYKQLHLPVQFEVIYGGAHGGKEFYDETRIELMDQFIQKYIQQSKTAEDVK